MNEKIAKNKIIRNETKNYLNPCYKLSDDFCFSKEPLDKRPSSGYAGFKGTPQNSVTAPFDDLAIYKRHLDVKDDDIVYIDMVSDHLLPFLNTCALSWRILFHFRNLQLIFSFILFHNLSFVSVLKVLNIYKRYTHKYME